uniref:Uncharacterized protein n=1 Tax=Euplotes harpa TaxID=151035 RepID=A0A7S3NB47_9SPIT|mmetsp:Transcript_2637/g.3368  ORF Transcript_2637/g.3368 Transcript_2637/m.3368 type:complete len:106 (+) Transcript_2637:115-432(+)
MVFSSDQFRDKCMDYIFIIFYRQLLILFISCLIFCINEGIEFIFVRLSHFQKHKSWTSFNGQLTLLIFMLMYINTGVIMMLASIDIPMWPLTYIVSDSKYKDTAK